MANAASAVNLTQVNISVTLPGWVGEELAKLPDSIETIEARMKEVLRFARLNFEKNTGGPFAAGVFEKTTGRLISMGVNRVVEEHCSSAHAEVVALSLAQKKLQTYDLGAKGMPEIQLIVNWRPCSMCMGATLWSGVRSLVIGGSGPELEQITGFDEGPIHPEWKSELQKRNVELIDNLMNDEAIQVCRDFKAAGNLVYNGRQG